MFITRDRLPALVFEQLTSMRQVHPLPTEQAKNLATARINSYNCSMVKIYLLLFSMEYINIFRVSKIYFSYAGDWLEKIPVV
jgi:hypothetical protein